MNRLLRKKTRKYEPIFSGTKEWPVVQLSKNRTEFINNVVDFTFKKIVNSNKNESELKDELQKTLHYESLRIRKNPWRVDPADDKTFWESVKNDLVDLVEEDEIQLKGKKLLEKIIRRYAEEIAGNFKNSRYRLAREIIKFGFARLLNATRMRSFGAMFKNKYTLQDKIQIEGEANQIRSLAKIGTVIMVPTHFSNLDSVLIGWVINELGLPAFTYGAGLNLFNIKILAYFMNSVGAYKVDRRKKNPIYLQTLKSYSNLAIQEGAHSLFFPGGTRSRSGAIETQLKLGLLGTAMEAQRSIFMKYPENEEKKIFVVPVTINYNFVLEAPELIKEYLKNTGREKFYVESDKFSTSFKMLKFMVKFFTKGSDISLSIGKSMDLLGNYVDDLGNSYDKNGRFVNTRDYFSSQGVITENKQRESEYTRRLSKIIVQEFHRINIVFASHLVAFVAFRIWIKRYKNLSLFDFLRTNEEELVIEYEEFVNVFDKAKKLIEDLKKQKKLNIASHFEKPLDEVIKLGIYNVGMYHNRRPLLMNDKNQVYTQDLLTLYYYHNRMHGYGLEEQF